MNLMINISRLHPLLVHLPIGIMFFAAFLFVIKKRKGTTVHDSSIFLALLLSFGSAAFSAITGWLLSHEGGYDEQILFWHKWLGIATTVGIFILLWVYKNQRISGYWSGGLFFTTILLLSATGHFGGSLTHGSAYLFEKESNEFVFTTKNLQEAPIYQSFIQPILQKKCVACHKPSKKKGGLVMTTVTDLMKGGKSGQLFNSEQPQESEFLKRINLPIDEKKHMPPKGKSQLTADEITLLTWWIKNNACTNCKLASIENKERITTILQKYHKTKTPLYQTHIKPLTNKQITNLQESGIRLTSIATASPFVSLQIPQTEKISRATLQSMQAIRQNITELNLSGTTIHSRAVDFITSLVHLQKLQLQHTNVSDEHMIKIKQLKNIQSLNLYNTTISDESIAHFSAMPTLEKLYLWQSKVSPEGIAQLQKANPLLKIYNGVDSSIFGKAVLNPPAIITDTDWFADSLHVVIKSDFRNSQIHYTLDGSEPDSSSTIYTQKINLTKSAKVKAMVRKKGWGTSKVSSKQLIKKSHKIAKVSLYKPPSEKYPGQGAKTLIDWQKSTPDFRSGKWLGYEASHLTAILELEKTDTVSTIFVSALSEPNSWIFYPQALIVSLSTDGKIFQKVNQIQLDKDHRAGTELSSFEVSFAPSSTKYIKVAIRSILKNPDWHPNPGEGAWLFIDEILIN